jgi:hypothetical protein
MTKILSPWNMIIPNLIKLPIGGNQTHGELHITIENLKTNI